MIAAARGIGRTRGTGPDVTSAAARRIGRTAGTGRMS
jgi:hypothetical protein